MSSIHRASPVAATPRVSVIIGVFNGEEVVGRCIESIVNQSLPPFEILVIDDGSTDSSSAVLAGLQDRWPGLIQVHRQENQGVAAVLNRAISMSSGEFVAVADQDDFYLEHRLEASVELLGRTGADMMGGQLVGTLGKRLRLATSRFSTDAEGIAERIRRGFDPLPHTTMMVRRNCFDRFGSYRLVRRAADLELMLRWADRGAQIVVSPEVMGSYTLRPEHLSIDTQTRWMVATGYAREICGLPDDLVPDFADWFAGFPIGPAQREARRRVLRLTARLALGSLPPARSRR
jgi:glycosyltransferase involved in cell wall biosynthesis